VPCAFAMRGARGSADVYIGTCAAGASVLSSDSEPGSNPPLPTSPRPEGMGSLLSGVDGCVARGNWPAASPSDSQAEYDMHAELLDGRTGCRYTGHVRGGTNGLRQQGWGTQTCVDHRGGTMVHVGQWREGELVKGRVLRSETDTDATCGTCWFTFRIDGERIERVRQGGTCAARLDVDSSPDERDVGDRENGIGVVEQITQQLASREHLIHTLDELDDEIRKQASVILAGDTVFAGGVYGGDRNDSGLPHGRGRVLGYVTDTGPLYDGEWKDGVPSGQGTMTDVDGSVYRGSFERGVRHGDGELRFPAPPADRAVLELVDTLPPQSSVHGTWNLGLLEEGVKNVACADGQLLCIRVTDGEAVGVELVQRDGTRQQLPLLSYES
jgi:hypothetical protein